MNYKRNIIAVLFILFICIESFFTKVYGANMQYTYPSRARNISDFATYLDNYMLSNKFNANSVKPSSDEDIILGVYNGSGDRDSSNDNKIPTQEISLEGSVYLKNGDTARTI